LTYSFLFHSFPLVGTFRELNVYSGIEDYNQKVYNLQENRTHHGIALIRWRSEQFPTQSIHRSDDAE
jgi:hypothetical protein